MWYMRPINLVRELASFAYVALSPISLKIETIYYSRIDEFRLCIHVYAFYIRNFTFPLECVLSFNSFNEHTVISSISLSIYRIFLFVSSLSSSLLFLKTGWTPHASLLCTSACHPHSSTNSCSSIIYLLIVAHPLYPIQVLRGSTLFVFIENHIWCLRISRGKSVLDTYVCPLLTNRANPIPGKFTPPQLLKALAFVDNNSTAQSILSISTY